MAISGIARELADEVIARGLPASPVPIILPDDDDSTEDTEGLGYAEGQSFIIEYLDAAGRSSTRRITVWSISRGAHGIPCLHARCHERNATRLFRVDRIRTCIDYDGEVHSNVPEFLTVNFGMSPALAIRSAGEDRDRWQIILAAIRAEAVILAALAKADGTVVAAEIDAATDYLAARAERTGYMLDQAEIAALQRFTRRLRPSEDAIIRSLNEIAGRGTREIQKLLLAAMAVIDADGLRHDREMMLIDAIAEDLTGAKLFSCGA